MRKKDSITLSCFTPLASLATFGIEATAAIYLFWKDHSSRVGRLVTATLLCLGLFQLSEYMMCTRGITSFWIKFGYLAITLLPPLGLHIINEGIRNTKSIYVADASALALGIWIVRDTQTPFQAACTGNYVELVGHTAFNHLYGWFYFGFLFWACGLLIHHLIIKKTHREFAKWLLYGYVSFLLPTFAIFMVVQLKKAAIPSVMCGFALLFALILVGKVMPAYREELKRAEKVM